MKNINETSDKKLIDTIIDHIEETIDGDPIYSNSYIEKIINELNLRQIDYKKHIKNHFNKKWKN